MTDLPERLTALRRPALLVRAARHGIARYDRARDLRRILRGAAAGSAPARIVSGLIEAEAELDDSRRSGDVTYSVARHVEVLIALMAEARLLPAPARTAP